MPRIWIDTHLNMSMASGAQDLVSLMTGVSSAQTRFDRMTLLRTIVGIDVAYTVHDSGEGSQNVAIGVGIASQEAFAAGTVSDPNSATDFPTRGWVWKWRGRIFGFAADQPAIMSRRIDIDLRGMRKLENGEAFIVANNDPNEGTATAIEITGLLRQLWLVG